METKSKPVRKATARAENSPAIEMVRKEAKAEASYEAYNTFAALLKYTTTVDANWKIVQRASSDGGSNRGYRHQMSPLEIRAIGDEADMLRLAIEDVKATIRGEDWEIDVAEGYTLDPGAEALLNFPDRETPWDIWASMLLEEVMVPDAACIFPWWKNGKLDRLEPIDGTSIRPVPDKVSGRLPDPPAICYEQDANGKTLQFTKDTLWMMVMNKRVGTLRGFSPVEQVAARASVNIAKLIKDLQRWLRGGVPAGILGSPDGMQLEGENGLKAYQKWLDNNVRRPGAESLLQVVAGNPRFAPVPALKIDKEHEDILARIICKALGSDPTSLVSDVNRAVSDAMGKWAALRGVYPYLWFLKSVVDKALPLAGFPGHTLRWKAHRNAEEQARRQQEVLEYESGLRSWEETRQGAGLSVGKPDLKDKHFVFVGKSMQAFDPLEEPGKKEIPPQLQPFVGGPQPPGGQSPPPPPPPPNKDAQGGEREIPSALKSCSYGRDHDALRKGGAAFYAASFRVEAERTDLKRWEGVARKAIRAGKEPKAFKSDVIAPWKLRLVQAALPVEGLGLSVFDKGGLLKATKALGSGIGVSVSPRAKAHETNGEALWLAIVDPIARAVIDGATREAEKTGKLAKSFLEEGDVPPPSVDTWNKLIAWLEEAYQIGVDDTAKLLGHGVDASMAYEYAKARAGALIGRSWDQSAGEWIANPDQAWSIEGTLRDRANSIVSEAVADGWTEGQLQEALSQSFEIGNPSGRPQMIARTELGFAYNQGAGMNYGALGVNYVLISDGGGGGSCDACNDADGKVWTLEKFLENPLEHPNCSRVGLPADESEYQEEAA